MKTVALGEIASLEYGFAFDSKSFNSERRGLPLIRIRDVVSGRSTTYYDGHFDARYVVRSGEYLIGMDGQFNLASWKGGEALLNQRVCRIGAITHEVDREYLSRYLPLALKKIEDDTPFVTVKHLSAKALRAIKVPLPPLDEQRRIAAILDQADAIRVKRRQVLAHLDSLAQSIFHDMFGDPQNWPLKWNMGVVADMAESVNYGTSAKAGSSGDWPILRMGNVTDAGRLDLNDLKYIDLAASDVPKFTVRRGDLLFNRTNSMEHVGKSCVVTSDAPLAFAGYLIRVRLRAQHSSDFLSAYLASPFGRSVRKKAAKPAVNQANISASELRALRIALPPSNLQREFSSRVEQINFHRATIERALAADDVLFSSLQSRAFKGEL